MGAEVTRHQNRGIISPYKVKLHNTYLLNAVGSRINLNHHRHHRHHASAGGSLQPSPSGRC